MATATLKHNALARSESPLEAEIVRTDGAYVIDHSGRRYLDFLSGWCVGNLGWGQDAIKNAIRDYDGPDYVSPHFRYQPWDELAAKLCAMAPGHLKRAYRTTGGSESVDAAMQVAMAFTGRKKFLSVEGAYHGNTIGTISIGDNDSKEKLPSTLQGCMKIDLPLDEKALRRLETKLKTKEFAAFIFEPVLCKLGVHIATVEFMEGARKLCDKYGTLLIADEVACGFGRTGKLFACEHFNLEPDVLCLAKAMSGGYAGIGATLTTEKIFSKVKEKVSIYSTYGWHPLSTAATLAALDYYSSNEEKLMQHVTDCSQHFRTRLSQMPFRKGGKLSMIGLAIAIDVKKSSYAEHIVEKCLKERLIISNQEEKLTFFPPLTVSHEEIDEGLDILENSL